mgnify:CR=1 FL=1
MCVHTSHAWQRYSRQLEREHHEPSQPPRSTPIALLLSCRSPFSRLYSMFLYSPVIFSVFLTYISLLSPLVLFFSLLSLFSRSRALLLYYCALSKYRIPSPPSPSQAHSLTPYSYCRSAKMPKLELPHPFRAIRLHCSQPAYPQPPAPQLSGALHRDIPRHIWVAIHHASCRVGYLCI